MQLDHAVGNPTISALSTLASVASAAFADGHGAEASRGKAVAAHEWKAQNSNSRFKHVRAEKVPLKYHGLGTCRWYRDKYGVTISGDGEQTWAVPLKIYQADDVYQIINDIHGSIPGLDTQAVLSDIWHYGCKGRIIFVNLSNFLAYCTVYLVRQKNKITTPWTDAATALNAVEDELGGGTGSDSKRFDQDLENFETFKKDYTILKRCDFVLGPGGLHNLRYQIIQNEKSKFYDLRQGGIATDSTTSTGGTYEFLLRQYGQPATDGVGETGAGSDVSLAPTKIGFVACKKFSSVRHDATDYPISRAEATTLPELTDAAVINTETGEPIEENDAGIDDEL